MSANRVTLQLITMEATTAMPRVVGAIAKAAHGPRQDRGKHLQQAIAHTSELLGKLQAVAADVERIDKLAEVELP